MAEDAKAIFYNSDCLGIFPWSIPMDYFFGLFSMQTRFKIVSKYVPMTKETDLFFKVSRRSIVFKNRNRRRISKEEKFRKTKM